MTHLLEKMRSSPVEIHPHAERCPSLVPDAASLKFGNYDTVEYIYMMLENIENG
jgi:hypothetical protein